MFLLSPSSGYFILILHVLNGAYFKERIKRIRRKVRISKQKWKRDNETERVKLVR